jgi:hypothetical protein
MRFEGKFAGEFSRSPPARNKRLRFRAQQAIQVDPMFEKQTYPMTKSGHMPVSFFSFFRYNRNGRVAFVIFRNQC